MDTQRLIAEVAKRHGILLDKNDPVLVTVTLNELILRDYVEAVKVAVEEAQLRTLTSSAHQLNDAKKAAAELVTRSGSYVAEQVRAAAAVLRADLERLLSAELEQVRAERDAAARDRKRVRAFLIASAVTTGVSVLAAVYASVG